ncbi:MAG TPA: hypothetical protein VGE97_08190, partial [Nitrososphaera sp.]
MKVGNDKLLWIWSDDALLTQKSLKIYGSTIFLIFIICTLVSSISTVPFTGNIGMVFAKKDNGGSGGDDGGSSSKDKGSDKGSGSDNGGGSSGSSGSSDNGGDSSGSSGSSDNNGGTPSTEGSDNSNTGSSDTGSTTSTPPPATEGSTTSTPPTAENQQTTCPDGSTPDVTGNCPTSTASTQETTQPPATTQQQTTCPDGSTPDVTGNCPTSTTPTEPNTAPAQTLTQQTCPPLPIDANGKCPGIDARGGGLGLPPPPPQPTSLGDGSFQLPTVPPEPNTGTIAPICPSGSHLVGSKCVVDGVSCPSGTVQDGDKCSPSQAHYNIPSNVAKLQDGTCPSGYHSTDVQCEINSQQKLPNGMCPEGTVLTTDDRCVTMPVLPGTTTGSGGGFIQMFPTVPAHKDGSCPAGSHEVGGSSGSAGQPGTGSVSCISDKPTTTTPATTTTTPIPVSAANGLDPTTLEPKCTTGYHFIDATHCVADSFKCPSGTSENVAKLVCEPIKSPSVPATTTTGTPGTTTTTGTPGTTTTTGTPGTTTTTGTPGTTTTTGTP